MLNKNATATRSINILNAIDDLIGWAGDLIQMTTLLANSLDTVPNVNTIMNYIGETPTKQYAFSIEDFIQDIDAVNIYSDLYDTRIDMVFKGYYNSIQYERYSRFLLKLATREGLPQKTMFQFFTDLAYLYVGKTDNNIVNLLTTAFSSILQYQTYDKDVWATPVANAFATKICNLIGEE